MTPHFKAKNFSRRLIAKTKHVVVLESNSEHFKIFDIWRSRGHFGGPQLFLLDIARSKIFTRSRATQKLHFKPINSLEAAGAGILQPKNRCKDEKQHHLVAKIKSRIFFVEALGPLNNSTTVFGRYYYAVKSRFFGISTPTDLLV